jgi:mannose-6-phosphate isomerase
VLRLENPVRHYDWGSPTFIPRLLGRAPDEQPCAELWMGAHESAPSIVQLGDERIALDALIARQPRDILGAQTLQRHGARLPFLFKVLAAERPLSIQAHPDRDQARAGFERENAAGIALDAAHRNYRDANHKPELIVALTPFVALKGFRSPEAIAEELRALDLRALDPLVVALQDGLRSFFETLMTRAEADTVDAVLGALASREDERARWVRQLAAQHPHDRGALAPLFLELVELSPGQALFLPARQLHAYLRGAGLELMASSDNVLRGGLTSKHVDVPELLATLRFEPSPPQVIEPRPTDVSITTYPTPAEEFALARIEIEGALELGARVTPAIVLCTEGRITATGHSSQALAQGDSVLLPAGTPALALEGTGVFWLAEVPTRSPA